MNEHAPRTDLTVGQIGERELIRRLSRWISTGDNEHIHLGLGDDCAELKSADGRIILTTDLLVENVHFLRSPATATGLGRKAAGANISDLAAAGAKPRALLVGLSLPADLPVEFIEKFYEGLHSFADAAGAKIVGGDTTRGEQLVVSITAVGWKDPAWSGCRRSDAKPGDNLYLTGSVGASRAAVQLMLSPELQTRTPVQRTRAILDRHYSPPLRVDVGLALSKTGERVAAIDISDSVYNEAGLLAQASGVQLELWLDKLPVDPHAEAFCRELQIDHYKYALFSGEEYELLFSSSKSLDEVNEILRSAGVQCTVTNVGTVNPGRGVILLQGGHPVDLSNETFDHF